MILHKIYNINSCSSVCVTLSDVAVVYELPI